MPHRADVAVVGAGIVGLAFAWEAARRGRSVVVFERDPMACGASVRNFGMIWPIGQPPGQDFHLALRSRERWIELGEKAGICVNPCGSLHVAYADDESAVLKEFTLLSDVAEFLSPAETIQRFPVVNPDGLKGALFSPTELAIDPRQALTRLPVWLADTYGVQFHFGTAVTLIESPALVTAAGDRCHAEQIFVCSGTDFETLFPDTYSSLGLRRCKLQMMRTGPQPNAWKLGPHLAGGLTLAHYTAFRDCPTLPTLRARFAVQYADYTRFGIHVMAAQNHLGEVVIGDSHEYDSDIDAFDKPKIDELIVTYLKTILRLPDWNIAARWHGVYAKHPTQIYVAATPQQGCNVITSPGGAGMTLSFGLAREWFDNEA